MSIYRGILIHLKGIALLKKRAQSKTQAILSAFKASNHPIFESSKIRIFIHSNIQAFKVQEQAFQPLSQTVQHPDIRVFKFPTVEHSNIRIFDHSSSRTSFQALEQYIVGESEEKIRDCNPHRIKSNIKYKLHLQHSYFPVFEYSFS